MTTAALPTELVQEIIEVSVECGLVQIAALARVSRGFYEIAHPILCRTLMYYEARSEGQWPVHLKNLTQWLEINGKHVRNVMWGIDIRIELLPTIFNYCPNITNLAVWGNILPFILSSILPSLSTLLHLTRLSLNVYELLGRSHLSKGQTKHGVLQTLTHLDIFHPITKWEHIEGITSLPCLTHLRLPDTLLVVRVCHDVINLTLRGCKRLKVLVILGGPSVSRAERSRVANLDDVPEISSGNFNDPRLVGISIDYLADWEYGAIRGKDFWALADEVVEKRLADLRDKESQISNSQS